MPVTIWGGAAASDVGVRWSVVVAVPVRALASGFVEKALPSFFRARPCSMSILSRDLEGERGGDKVRVGGGDQSRGIVLRRPRCHSLPGIQRGGGRGVVTSTGPSSCSGPD